MTRRYCAIKYSRDYPYKDADGTPAAAYHFCSCTHLCDATACQKWAAEVPPGDVLVTREGRPRHG